MHLLVISALSASVFLLIVIKQIFSIQSREGALWPAVFPADRPGKTEPQSERFLAAEG